MFSTITKTQWFLVVLFLLLFKNLNKIYYPQLWAEDGAKFLSQFYTDGFSTIIIPYSGYFHTVPRVLTIIIGQFPTVSIPYLISISTLIIYALTLLKVLDEDYAWVIKEKKHRIILIFFWCFAPALNEVTTNLANIHWVLLAYLGVLSLKNLNTNYSKLEIFFAFLCISTEGAVIIFLPIFMLRILLKYKISQKIKNSIGEFVIICFIFSFLISNILMKKDKESHLFNSDMLLVWTKHFTSNLISQPILGDGLTFSIIKTPLLFYSIIMILLLITSRTIIKNWSPNKILILTLFICVSLLPVLIFLARPDSSHILHNFFNYNKLWWNTRYSFFLAFFGTFFGYG